MVITCNGTSQGKKPGVMPMYVIPTAPGRSRLLWSFVMPRSSISGLFGLIFMAQPRWASHLFGTNRVLDGDSALLHAQVCSVLTMSSSLF